MITQEELGRPAARLREKANKLWNIPNSNQDRHVQQVRGSQQNVKPGGERKPNAVVREPPQRSSHKPETPDPRIQLLEKQLIQAEQETTLAWQEVELQQQQLIEIESRVAETE